MAEIDQEIAAYEAMRDGLERAHMLKWVLLFDRKLVAVYDYFEQAANDAVTRFGAGPYLIRQVGAAQMTLPASVSYSPGQWLARSVVLMVFPAVLLGRRC